MKARPPPHTPLIGHRRTSLDFLKQHLAERTAEIAAQLAPFAEAGALLETIPGVAAGAAPATPRSGGT